MDEFIEGRRMQIVGEGVVVGWGGGGIFLTLVDVYIV